MTRVPILPDAFHIRTCDAEDLAESFHAAIRAIGRPLCLYLTAAGELGFEAVKREEDTDGSALSLVGCYTEEATVAQIRDDILAFKREAL